MLAGECTMHPLSNACEGPLARTSKNNHKLILLVIGPIKKYILLMEIFTEWL